MKDILLITTLGIIALLLFHKCTDKAIQDDSREHLLEIKANQLAAEAARLDSVAQFWHDSAGRAKSTAYVYRTYTQFIRQHDTQRIRFKDSTYCANLEAENSGLWETVYADSVAYAAKAVECLKKDSIIRLKDSTNYLLRQGREHSIAQIRKLKRRVRVQNLIIGIETVLLIVK